MILKIPLRAFTTSAYLHTFKNLDQTVSLWFCAVCLCWSKEALLGSQALNPKGFRPHSSCKLLELIFNLIICNAWKPLSKWALTSLVSNMTGLQSASETWATVICQAPPSNLGIFIRSTKHDKYPNKNNVSPTTSSQPELQCSFFLQNLLACLEA